MLAPKFSCPFIDNQPHLDYHTKYEAWREGGEQVKKEKEFVKVFTYEMLDAIARIWTRSTISLVDVRHQYIYTEHPMRDYRMPSSMLVYTYGGNASVQLNETVFCMERFGIFHGGKGTTLSILPDAGTLGSFMVFYKAEPPSFFKKDLQRLLEQVDPFVQQFGYEPGNPLGLMRLCEQMLDSWSRATSMNHLHTKSLFYLTMHQIYRELESTAVKVLQPDRVAAVKQYLDDHYTQPVSMQAIARRLSISGGQLTRLFKEREGKSLQEYLIQKRLAVACEHLIHTDATIKEIAAGCGFTDEINLIRMFKKHFRMTPGSYRKINAMPMQDHDIDNLSQRLYNETGLDELVKSQRDGEFMMLGQTRSKQTILAAAISLMLLLSACGTAPANTTNGAAVQNTPAPAAVASKTEASEGQATRMYTDLAEREVEIPARAERIVTINMTGEAIALGIKPVGASETFMQYLDDEEKAGIESVGGADINFEKIASLEPDLIITPERVTQPETLEAYSKIAPTVVGPFFRGAEVSLRTVGEILGRSEEAEAWLEAYEEKAQRTKEALSHVVKEGQTGIVLQFYQKSIYVYPSGTYPTVNEVLGLKVPVESMKELTRGLELSQEVLPEYAADHIFVTTSLDYDQEYYDEILSSSIWQNLPAVKNDQVYFIGSRISGGDALSLDWALDEVVRLMSK